MTIVNNNDNNDNDDNSRFPAHDELGMCRASLASPEQSVGRCHPSEKVSKFVVPSPMVSAQWAAV